MYRPILATSLFVFASFLTVAPAEAQTAEPSTASASVTSANSSHGRGIGVGAVTMLDGTGGGLFTWGSPSGGFHVDGILGVHRLSQNGNNTTRYGLGGRFWYHVHAATFADFSLGGGLGIHHYETNPGGPGNDSRIDVSLEVGGQIRAFIVPNVALLADLGLGVTFGPTDDILLGAQSIGGGDFVAGTLGIAYFFE